MTFPDLPVLSWLARAEIILVLGALVLLVSAPRLEDSAASVSFLGILTAVIALGCGLQERGMARVGLVVIAVALAIAMLLLGSAELFEPRQKPEAAALLLVGGIGAVVLVSSSSSNSLLEMALGTELISLSSAGVIALGRGERPLEGAFKYFILTAVTFATLLFGMALVFLATGSLDAPVLSTVADGLRPVAVAGLALMGIGLCFKLAVVPTHFGALDAYTAGPSSFVGFVMLASKLGAVGALSTIATRAGASLQGVFLFIGLFTLGFAVMASFAQTDLRRLLAYSAVAHAGFLAVGLGSDVSGAEAALFYVIGYGSAGMLAFACLAGSGTDALPIAALRLGGALQLGRLRAMGLIVALLSLAGVPPLPGFWAKLAVLKAAWVAWGPAVAGVAALGGVVGVIYYLRPLPDLLTQTKAGAEQRELGTSAAVLITIVLVVALGVVPTLASALIPSLVTP